MTQRAYKTLRHDLISCALAPGSMLNVAAMHKSISASQAAVREALSRLAAEGLVQIEPNRGFRVAPISVGGFRELTAALLTVELPCIRASVLNGNTAWELNLVSTYHRALHTLELVVAGLPVMMGT